MSEQWDERAIASAVGFYERQIDRTAEALRRLADEVERHRAPRRSFVHEASYLISDLHNTMPNLPVGALLDAAATVDAMRAAQENSAEAAYGDPEMNAAALEWAEACAPLNAEIVQENSAEENR